jgi:hypothetical protein
MGRKLKLFVAAVVLAAGAGWLLFASSRPSSAMF